MLCLPPYASVTRFNPRARRGRDAGSMIYRSSLLVSIHAPAGGATLMKRKRRTRRKFQSTRPQGARLHTPYSPLPTTFVSIHAPAGGATAVAKLSVVSSKSFNPRARRGRDRRRGRCTRHLAVSIHAPAGGATENRLNTVLKTIVSIHAPAGGATILSLLSR